MSSIVRISTLLLLFSIIHPSMGCTLQEEAPLDEERRSTADELAPDQPDLTLPTDWEGGDGAEPDAAALGCRCVGTFSTTPFRSMHTGSCANSEYWLPIVLSDYIDCSQELCFQTLVITQPCYWEAPYWVVGGYIRYKCGERLCDY